MFVGYEGYVAVVCGILLAYCGYCLGKEKGFQTLMRKILRFQG